MIPENEKIRKAVKWISAQLQENPAANKSRLINEAAIRFDLNPQETQFLINFYQDSQ